jgi:aspartyl-tRNA(Asn)/glutamyl-tRNA(Gln) amidotransferase subunit A
VEREVQAAVDAAIDMIRSFVAEVREAELPMPDLGALIDVEAYAFHAPHLAKSSERYDPRTRNIILAGREISETDVVRLRQALKRHRSLVQDAFLSVDLVVLTTLPGLPLTIREAIDPFALHGCTFAFSLGGLPSISVPCGFSRSGLPIGLLIGGPPLSEPRVLALAQAYESVTSWHRRRPALES